MIEEGAQVIIKTARVLKSFQVRKSRLIRVEKSKFRLDGAVGMPYGTSFEVQRSELIAAQDKEVQEPLAEQDSDRDNRHLKDDGDNQKLTREDLQALKKKGVDVVGHLVENSATFNAKTEFAQQKYIKKKKKKWESKFTILKPNTRLVAEMYFSKGPSRICNLRYDSLAQILTYANVRAHANIMVCEAVAGLLVGAIIERLGGYGHVVQFYTGSNPSREALETFGFSTEVKGTMMSFPLIEVSSLRLRQHNSETNTTETDVQNKDTSSGIEQSSLKSVVVESSSTSSETQTRVSKILSKDNMDAVALDLENDNITSQQLQSLSGITNITRDSYEEQNNVSHVTSSVKGESNQCENTNQGKGETEDTNCDATMDDVNCDDTNCTSDVSGDEYEKITSNTNNQQKRRHQPLSEEEKTLRRERRIAENARTKALLETQNMDALIVACKQHPTPIVLGLIEYLAPGRPIVVHCMYKEPLLDCYVQLRNRGGVVNLKLSETWFRQYQVLPMRTHPVIQMSGTGGYILTGITATP